MLRDGLVRRLVLTADSQPNVAFVPLYQPAVPCHLSRQVEQQQGGKQEEKLADPRSHGAQEELLNSPQRKERKERRRKEGGGRLGCQVRGKQAKSLMESQVSSGLSSR